MWETVFTEDMVMRKPPIQLSVQDRLAAGGLIDMRSEFCPWANISHVTAYREIEAGNLVVSRIGKRVLVAAADALAYRDSKRVSS